MAVWSCYCIINEWPNNRVNKQLNEVIRVKKHFVMFYNIFLEDDRLFFKAKGMKQ